MLRLLLPITLLACAPPHYTKMDYVNFENIVDQFQIEAISRGKFINLNIKIIYVTSFSDPRVLGTCNHQNQLISIKQTFFENADSYMKELLLFHELGHCVLNLRHLEGYGIMSQGMGYGASYTDSDGDEYVGVQDYIIHRKEYLDVLFR